MSDQPKKFYVTTPIYYVNARPHIGHAYTTIVADVLARRHRLLGEDVFFLTGTDEHGQKIERSAAAAGIPPQQFADEVSAQFRTLWDRMGLTYDRYIRTTDATHKLGAQKLFQTLYERGFIYLSTYTGAYCVSDEAFVDAPVGTPCPDCGRLLEEVTEENFFFKLSEFQRPLIDLIESGQLSVEPESRRNEVLSFIRGNVSNVVTEVYDQAVGEKVEKPDPFVIAERKGKIKKATVGYYVPGALKDLSVSRSSFTWGIPVPAEVQQQAKATQNHIIYVWLDALANYITAIGYGATDEQAQAEFAKFWPADLQLVGKEIIRFHCVYWPAFLLAAGLPTPKAITAHGWLLFDNSKMSKSKGNIVRTETILQAFGTLCPAAGSVKGTASAVPSDNPADRALAPEVLPPTDHERDVFASDVLRYFLLREIPFGQDGSFSFDALITRYNADLANGYGNLVSRTLSMISKYFDGVIPESPTYADLVVPDSSIQKTQIFDRFVNGNQSGVWSMHHPSEAGALPLAFDHNIGRTHFIWALQACSELIRLLDSKITTEAPWKFIDGISDEEMKERRGNILYLAAESIRIITALLYPIMPYATARVWTQLGLGDIEAAASNGELNNLQWGGLQPGTKLGPLAPIFPRADKGLAQIMTDMENSQLATPNSKLESSSERPEAPLKQAFTPTPAAAVSSDPTHPGAPPAALDEPSGTLPVAGSTAHTTGPDATPSHAQAPASGIFGQQPSQAPIATSSADASTQNQQITIDDFAKVELRVAEIKVCERIPKADKLLRLEVDLGHEKRQILSGIAEFYTPEDLIGRRIIVITNLAPRKMRGLDSHGMLLAASGPSDGPDGGKPILATVPEGVPLGTRLK